MDKNLKMICSFSGSWHTINKGAAEISHESSTPLEIQTDAELNANKKIHLLFLAANKGQYSTRTLQISLGNNRYTFWMSDHCASWVEFTLPASCSNRISENWVWTVRKTDKSITIHCNDEVAINLIFSNNINGDCDYKWNADPLVYVQIPTTDTASKMYRTKPAGQWNLVKSTYM